ncbi:cadherin-like domain-containing protein [Tistrella mobilis]|uniref:cadherin-like domain-containing protein n=1 Tax=Tistrella mobilis TaxID=171437 RepID=UPI003A70039C
MRRFRRRGDHAGRQTIGPRRPGRRGALAQALEPRMMFDAAGVATAAEALQDQAAQDAAQELHPDTAADGGGTDAGHPADAHDGAALVETAAQGGDDGSDVTAAPAATGDRREVAFIDTRVTDWQTLAAGLADDVEIVVLDAGRDGLEQIADWMAEQSGAVDAIHIISEGSVGEIWLGSSTLSDRNIDDRAGDLAVIGAGLAEDGDILLYGCDVAGGSDGLAFLGRLAELTGADVAASDDATGSVAANGGGRFGDWDLEVSTGRVETTIAVTEDTRAGYDGLMATFTAGTAAQLETAITNANAAAGTDQIDITANLTVSAGFSAITDNVLIRSDDTTTRVLDATGLTNGSVFTVTDATVTFARLQIENATRTSGGGAGINFTASGSDTLTLTDITMNNLTATEGGAVYMAGGQLAMTGTNSFVDNQATSGAGGAIYISGGNFIHTVTGQFTTNTATTQGGAIYQTSAAGATLNVTDSSFDQNSATQAGGAIRIEGNASGNITFSVADSSFSGNTGGLGGAISTRTGGGSTTIERSTFTSNETTNGSGGGGAVELGGTATASEAFITDSTFTQNTASGTGGSGGAVLIAANALVDLDIVRSTFDRNVATSGGSGGAVALLGTNSTVSVVNSTFSGNTATYGSAIESTSALTVAHSTFSGNSASDATYNGTIDSYGGSVSVSHTILANNTGGGVNVTGGSATNVGWNIYYGNSLTNGGWGTNPSTDKTTDPNLGALADNGGYTQTMKPGTGSSAIDAGNASITGQPATDQTGATRISGSAIDIGAVEAVNDSTPVLGGPQTVSWTEGNAPTVALPGITVADDDGDLITSAKVWISNPKDGDVLAITSPGPYSASLAMEGGSLVLTLTGSGTAAQMQAALRTVTYSSTSDAPTWGNTGSAYTPDAAGSRILRVTVTDADGATSDELIGSGVAVTSLDDDPPAILADTFVYTPGAYSGNSSYAQFAPDLFLIDDTAMIKSATVQLVDDPDDTAERPRIAGTYAGITISYDTYTKTLTFTGTASLNTYQEALRNVEYKNTSSGATVDTTDRTIRYTVTDANDQVGTFDLTIEIDKTPTVATNTGTTVAEGGSGSITTAMLEASDDYATGADLIYTVAALSHLTVSLNGSTLSTNGTFTQQDIDDGLVTFQHDGGETAGTLTFTLKQSSANYSDSVQHSFTVSTTPVNDAPVVNDTSASPLFSAGGSPVAVAESATIVDVDSGNLTSVVLTLTTRPGGTSDRIAMSTTGADDASNYGINVAYNNATGTLTLSGTASVAQYQTVLRGVVYAYTGAATSMPGGDRVVSIVATDDSGDSATEASAAFERTIEVDVPPKVDTNTGTTIDEGGSTTITSAMLSSSDTEDTDPANVTYTLTTAPASGTLKLNGTALAVNDTFTQKDIDDGLLTYEHDGSETTSGSFGFSVTDTTNHTVSSQTFAITVTAVNDAPVITLPGGASVSGTEDTVFNLTSSYISFADADSASSDVIVTITSTDGTLGSIGTADGVTVASTTNGLTLTGTVAAINAYLAEAGNLNFTPTADATSDRTISIDITDQGNTGSGGAKADSATLTINLTAVNDAPTIDGSQVALTTTNENTPSTTYSVSDWLTDVNYADPDSGAVSGIAITGIVGNGAWQYTTDGTNWYGLGTAASDAAALLFAATTQFRFIPDNNRGGPASLTFRGWDQTSGTATSGATLRTGDASSTGGSTAYSVEDSRAGMVVTQINDAPTLSNTDVTLDPIDRNDVSTPVTVSDLLTDAGYGDVDASPSSGIAITALTGTGRWEYSTDGTNWYAVGTVSVNASLLLAADAQLRYDPAGNTAETATISFRAWDQTIGTATSGSIRGTADTTITGSSSAYSSALATGSMEVTVTNEAPLLTVPGVLSVNEEGTRQITGISISDSDDLGQDYVLTITAPGGSFTATGTADVTVSAGAQTLILTGSRADINAFISGGNVSYRPGVNVTGYVSLSVGVSDQDPAQPGSAGGSFLVSVGAVNDAPDVYTIDNGVDVVGMPEPISNPIWMLDAPGGGHYVVSSRTTGGDAYQNVLVYRYNADGSIDTSYGTDGAAYFAGTVPSAVKVLDSGELIIAGRAAFDSSLVVTRLATDGSVVSGFPMTVIQASTTFGAVDIEIDGSDRIYVTATLTPTSGDTSTVVFRFTADGTADGVFNVGASIPGSEQALDSVIQPDGKVVTLAAQGRDLVVYRHNADRTLDTSFGTGGYLIIDTDLLGGGTGAQAVSVQADGSILVASATEDSGFPGQQVPVIWRLTADGALDTGFGLRGVATGEAAHTVSFAFAPDGGIIVVGTNSFAADISTTVQRFTADGALDGGFGRDGGFTIGGMEFPVNHTSVRIDADTGEILLGGIHYDSALQPADIYFARYNATGQAVFDADPAAYTENGAAVVIAPTIAVDDVDLGDADTLDGFTVSLTRDGGADGQDQFSAADGGTLDALTEGQALVVSGTTIGTVVTNSAGALVLSLNAAATRALVNEALRQIAYANSSDAPPASVDLVWTVNDGNAGTQGTGGAAEGTLTSTVAITAVNDAPVITVPGGGTITVTEDTATAITGISFADADAGSGTVEVTLSVDAGTITATSGAGVTVTDGTKAIMLSGTIADINAFIAAQGVTFQTDTDDTGDVTLTVDIDDLGNSGGASETASETVTITVDAVNDAPDLTTMPDGVVVVDGPGDMDSVGGIVALPDGSYYQFGVDTDVAPNMVVIARYDADGKLDTSFGTNGIVTLDSGGTFTPGTALLQSNGKLLISGTVSPSGGTTAAVLISLNDDGSMDEGFGTSGVVVFNEAGVEFSLFKVTVDDTDRILVAGMNFTGAAGTTDGLLYRLLADGSIDTAFNGGAPVAIDLGGNETLLSVAVQDDGKIVVAGANDDGAILQRYNADGTLDTGFGGSGTVTIDDPDIFESSMIVLPQSAGGMIVVNMHVDVDTGLPVTTLVRLADDGSVDGSFGSGGSLVFTGNLTTDATLLADGSVVLVGTRITITGGTPTVTASIIKIGTDGQLDTSFGTNGEVTFGDDLRSFTISSLTIDDNGDLLLGGSYLGCGCGGDEIFAARFTADGTPVIGFNMDPTHVEDGGFTAIDPEIDIYDPELWLVDNHDGMVITITRDGGADADDLFGAISGGTLGDLTEGEDLTVGGTVIGTVTTNAGGTLVLTLNANATYDLVNEAAKQIGYATASDTPPASVDLLWSVDDGNTGAQGSGGALTGTHVTTVNIQATNDAPVVTDLSSSPVYTAGGAAVAVVGSAALSDVDSANLTSVVVTFTTRPGGTSDYMGLFVPAANYANDHGISYTFNGAAGTYTLSGTASVADYQTVLQGLAFLYTGASTTMPGGDRVVSIVATDDSGDTATQTSVAFERTIEVNAAPKVDTNTGTTVDEGGSTTITSAMLSSSDSEDTDPADVTYTLTTAPASGTLKLDGTTLEVGDTFTQKDIDDGLVTYDHDGSEGASGGFGFSVKDTTNLTLSSQSFAITISAVNDAPELTAPASIDVTEDTETALTGISISDVDAGTGDVTVTFTVGEGELAATSTADVTVGGTATALTLTGTVADINAFISGSGLTFTPDAEASGDVTLTIDVDDGGNTGSGGAKTDTATVTLAVSAVNDAPEITAPATIDVTEDVETALTGISISDVDAGTGDVTVTLDVLTGTLSATSGSGVVVGGTATSLTLTGTVTDINAFIAASGVSYTPVANDASDVTLTVTVDDGGNTGPGGAKTDSATITLDVTAVNDAPVVTDLSSSPVYTAGGAAVAVVGSAALSDVDSANLTSVVVTFTTRPGGTSDYMGLFVPAANYANDHGISYTFNGAAGTYTLSGTASVADYQTVLQGLAFLYTGASTTMPGGDRVVSIVATDDSGDTDTQTSVAFERTIEVNAAPKVDTNTGTTVDEGGSTTITSAMLSSSDSEDTDPADVTYTLTTAPASGTLKLDGTTLEVGDTFTQKDIDDGLVTYDHDGSEGASGGFGFSVKDTTNLTLSSQSFAITISAVNDAPELTAPASIDVTEDTETALTGISISDVDAGTGDVTVTFTVGEGELAATSTADVTVGGTATALTLTGTVADINAFISGSGLTFTPDAEASGDVTLTIDVDDGGNTGSGGAKTDTATVTLAVSAVNDAPEITAPATIDVTEDVETALTGISISDVDAGTGDVTVTLDVLTGTLSATSGSGVVVGGTATSLTLTGTVTDINAFIAASGVSYTPVANDASDVTLTVTVDDGGNTGPGGAKTDSATITLDVTAVNDAPVVTDLSSSPVYTAGGAAVAVVGSAALSDVDSANLTSVVVTFTTRPGGTSDYMGLFVPAANYANDHGISYTFNGAAARTRSRARPRLPTTRRCFRGSPSSTPARRRRCRAVTVWCRSSRPTTAATRIRRRVWLSSARSRSTPRRRSTPIPARRWTRAVRPRSPRRCCRPPTARTRIRRMSPTR